MKSSTKPLRSAAELEEILRPTCPWETTRFLQSVAIDSAIAEAAKTVDFSLQSVALSFDTEPGTVAVDLCQRAESKAAAHLAGLLAARYVIDQCGELPAIREKLAPLFTELHAARAAEAEQARLASIARQGVREDIEAKRQAALAVIEAEAQEQLAAVG